MASKVSPAKLRDAFLIDLQQVWDSFRNRYPDDTPYLFALYGVEDTPRLTPHILTEESLTAAAQRYVGSNAAADVLDETRDDLRFSIPDSPRFGELLSGLPHVDEIFSEHAESLGEAVGYRMLAEAAIAALKMLDDRQVFGTGHPREQVLLMIVTEDCQFDWTKSSVRQLNPPAAVKRFNDLTELGGPYSSADWVAISHDRQFVFSSGHRVVIPGKPERRDSSVSEIVCYRFDGMRLDRHWEFNFPSFGDSIRAAAVEPHRETFVVVRLRYTKHEPTTMLMRFGPKSSIPLNQRTYSGEAGSFAISHDGNHLAVAQHDKSLMILDREFNLLHRFPTRTRAGDLQFLRSGELLYSSGNHLLRMNPTSGQQLAKIPLRCFRMSLGGDEKLLAVSRWFPRRFHGREPRPFGMKVLSLPDYKLYRRFFRSGHALVIPGVSPDGRFLVCQSQRVKGFRTSAVAFDLTTGKLLGEIRCFPSEYAFVPNTRTVLIAGDTFGGEPVKAWQIPTAL